MNDLVLTLAKNKKVSSKTTEILEFLVQESNLNLLSTSDPANFLKLQKKLCTRKVIKRVKNLFRSNNVNPYEINLASLADLTLSSFKEVSLEAELLEFTIEKVKISQKSVIVIELFSLVWLCLEIKNSSEEKADEELLTHIINLAHLDVCSISSILVNSRHISKYNEIKKNEEEKERNSFVDFAESMDIVQGQSNFNSKITEFNSIVEKSDVFEDCFTFENLLPINRKEKRILKDDDAISLILSMI